MYLQTEKAPGSFRPGSLLSAPRFNVSGEDGFSAVSDHEVRGDVQLVLGELGAAPETPAELLGERFELNLFPLRGRRDLRVEPGLELVEVFQVG